MTECKTEYITKEQALEAILSTVELTGEQRMQVWNKIKSIPAADVVEVVRCKDCKDFRPWGGQSKLGDCMVYVCDGEDPFTMEETDFCSDGERMDGGEIND